MYCPARSAFRSTAVLRVGHHAGRGCRLAKVVSGPVWLTRPDQGRSLKPAVETGQYAVRHRPTCSARRSRRAVLLSKLASMPVRTTLSPGIAIA